MASYFWDLGFDFNSVLNRNDEHILPNGLVLVAQFTIGSVTVQANVPATPIGVSPGDTVFFNVFNITANLQGAYEIKGGEIKFSNAVAQRDESGQVIISPFNNPDGSYMLSFAIPAILEPNATEPSIIFSGIQAPEAVSATSTSNFATFPIYSIGGLTVENEGRFLITFNLIVDGPTGQMIFFDDPEMIVGGTN